MWAAGRPQRITSALRSAGGLSVCLSVCLSLPCTYVGHKSHCCVFIHIGRACRHYNWGTRPPGHIFNPATLPYPFPNLPPLSFHLALCPSSPPFVHSFLFHRCLLICRETPVVRKIFVSSRKRVSARFEPTHD